MHLVEGRLLLSPSDLVGFLACEHLTQLELAAARGELVRPVRSDPELDLLARKGQTHETTQLGRLASEHGEAVEIADHGETLEGLQTAEEETLAAMRTGARVIYQAAFFDGRWRGRADFLLRVERPSALGAWSYEVADAKLARSVKVAALLQMCEYSHQLTRLQGTPPERMHVILGTGLQESHRVCDYASYFRAARERFEVVAGGSPQQTYPDPVDHCGRCRWLPVCEMRRRDDDHLCLVAGMRRDQTRRLAEAGIGTVAQLASAPPEPVAQISDTAWERLRRQAALQVQQRVTGTPVYELIDNDQVGLGLAALPPPSTRDLFFDMEGDPFVEDGGLEYLFGITEIVDGAARYHAFWAHDRASEKAAFEDLVDFVIRRRQQDPSAHVYHYAQYETAAMKRLMSRHGTREDEVDRLLRAGAFVDLYQVVRQSVRVSRESYSLKSLEAFYMPPRTEEIAEGAASIVAYERWRETRDQAELDALAAYNEVDCESTWRLRGWLEERREEWGRARGTILPRPDIRPGDPSEALLQATQETALLASRLTSEPLTVEQLDATDEVAARTLLANLLDWHRREAKAAWWTFYDRQAKTDEELVEDREALGCIAHAGEVRTEKKSVVHRYVYTEAQEHRIEVGATPCDPRTGKPAGQVVSLNDELRELELKRGPRFVGVDHPRALIPAGPIRTDALRDALRRVAGWVIDHGFSGPGKYRAARDLVMRVPPRIPGLRTGEPLVEAAEDPANAAVRLVASMDGGCLAVQGPPGAGKTYTGAQIIMDQVRRGQRVAVCATTHRAIGELLNAVCRLARQENANVRILQKCDAPDGCPDALVRHTSLNEEVDEALRAGDVDVIAGTQWLLCRPEIEGLVDVVVIDEAGQMSLANALAASCAGEKLVLLGDPQQLTQPSQGIHPPGAGVSALEHLLAGHETVPPDRGVFLHTTRRMHPEVCEFISDAFYERRLTSHPDCAIQRIVGDGVVAGAGLRLASVSHAGNRTWSPEEVAVTRHLVDALLETSWTNAHGRQRPVGLDDILVVAPYNVQVRRLRDHLPLGIRVGTVDKFQGQEAPVTIYAMATSSAEDVPRNLEFLFSHNRLNVALSRARAVAVVVCSPRLLEAGCRTPEQLRLVNALCLFAEMATPIEVDPTPHKMGAGIQVSLPL